MALLKLGKRSRNRRSGLSSLRISGRASAVAGLNVVQQQYAFAAGLDPVDGLLGYPGGQQEHITGFKTEADALDWIANDSISLS